MVVNYYYKNTKGTQLSLKSKRVICPCGTRSGSLSLTSADSKTYQEACFPQGMAPGRSYPGEICPDASLAALGNMCWEICADEPAWDLGRSFTQYKPIKGLLWGVLFLFTFF